MSDAQPASTSGRISAALAASEFLLVYQPQVFSRNGGLAGFEALLRWNSPQQGWISPAVFIPAAEQSGGILELGSFALRRAIKDSEALCAITQHPIHVAVNVSPMQLSLPRFAAEVITCLKTENVPMSRLHLEITETALLDEAGVSVRNIQQLAESGAEIWIDDFGTGYSSLKLLRDLPIAGLKIDQSFVRQLDQNQSDFRIVSAIIAMSHSLGLKVIAEGVENEAQLENLEQLGCDVVQGFLIGKGQPLQQTLEQWGVLAG